MPRFSVIVPAFKVQAYLHECLDSVLGQSFGDFELIAVDDCSPDSCRDIIETAAAADPRVVPVLLPENVGLGRARNAGIQHATGDYLLFLDGDDTLAPGALRAVTSRLETTGSPDVLVYDYERTYWWGGVIRNVRSGILAERPPHVFRLAERPDLLQLLMVVWNKAYRREFVEQQGLTFPPGYYEDTPWTYPSLLAAETIATLDRVCVRYRQRRQGNILHTTSRKHFDVFDQYDRVFAFLAARPELEPWRPVLHRRMVDHVTAIYKNRGRLPRDSRKEFFARSRDITRRHRARTTAGGRHHRRADIRRLLLLRGARHTFRLLWEAERVRRRAQTGGRSAARLGRTAALRLYYFLQRQQPLDPGLAVFAAYWNKGYACNPAAIEARVRELAPHIRTAWVTTPEYADTLPPGVRRLHPGSAAFWKAMARGTFFVNNVNFTGRYVKRPGQVHVQTHHGTPLKHMGLDLQEYPAGADSMDFDLLLERVDRWDYSLTANRHSTLCWERAYPSGYTTLEYGYPRNDRLLTATAQDIAHARSALGVPDGAVAVLYAPTHRDYQRTYRPRLDLRRISRLLGPGFVFLSRPHYFYDGNSTQAPARTDASAQVIDVSGHPSVEQLCLAADVLVTDYSSLMFDYTNLGRPVVVHADDWEAYRASRGTYFDLMATPPGLVSRSEDELIDLFATGAWNSPRSHELLTGFRNRFPSFDDGYAAERVVRRVFLGQDVPPATPRAVTAAPAPEGAAARPVPAGPPEPSPSDVRPEHRT